MLLPNPTVCKLTLVLKSNSVKLFLAANKLSNLVTPVRFKSVIPLFSTNKRCMFVFAVRSNVAILLLRIKSLRNTVLLLKSTKEMLLSSARNSSNFTKASIPVRSLMFFSSISRLVTPSTNSVGTFPSPSISSYPNSYKAASKLASGTAV